MSKFGLHKVSSKFNSSTFLSKYTHYQFHAVLWFTVSGSRRLWFDKKSERTRQQLSALMNIQQQLPLPRKTLALLDFSGLNANRRYWTWEIKTLNRHRAQYTLTFSILQQVFTLGLRQPIIQPLKSITRHLILAQWFAKWAKCIRGYHLMQGQSSIVYYFWIKIGLCFFFLLVSTSRLWFILQL